MYRISLDSINELFSAIAASEKLYIPADREDGQSYFTEWKEGIKLSDNLNTFRSAKGLFFPQVQDLMSFRTSGKKIEVIDTRKETEDFVVFGVRACDAASFGILDRVFLSDPVDSYYKNNRDHGTVMTLACNAPDETCFCGSFGIDPSEPAGDVSCWKDTENLYLKPLTEKGEKLVSALGSLLTECDENAADKVKADVKAVMKELPLADLKPDDFTADQLAVFKSEKWKELYRSCLGCGTCTFVCPTCQCYDIKDFDTGNGIERFRCWDSCMYSDFTMMAAGTPRLTQLERFRQRFMHKLVYFPMNNDGVYGCVGCGRCLKKCPVSMNIVKVMKSLGGDAK